MDINRYMELLDRAELAELFAEMKERKTTEAKLYKALDKMEAVIQHNEADISTWSISFWTPRQLRQRHTGFMKRLVLNELSRRNYLYRTVFQTETVCYICLIYRLSGNISNYNHRKEVYIWNYRQ